MLGNQRCGRRCRNRGLQGLRNRPSGNRWRRCLPWPGSSDGDDRQVCVEVVGWLCAYNSCEEAPRPGCAVCNYLQARAEQSEPSDGAICPQHADTDWIEPRYATRDNAAGDLGCRGGKLLLRCGQPDCTTHGCSCGQRGGKMPQNWNSTKPSGDPAPAKGTRAATGGTPMPTRWARGLRHARRTRWRRGRMLCAWEMRI